MDIKDELSDTKEEFLHSMSSITEKIPVKKILFFILALVGSFLTVGNAQIAGDGWIKVSFVTLYLYGLTMLAYDLYYNSSMDKAKLHPSYVKVNEDHTMLVNRAKKHQKDLAEYCDRKRDDIKRTYIRQLLSTTQIDYEFFMQNVVGKSVKDIRKMRYKREDGKMVRYDLHTYAMMIKASRVKAPALTPGRLLLCDYDDDATPERPLGRTGAEVKRQDKLKSYLTRIITIFFGGWMTFEFVFNDAALLTLLARMIPPLTAVVLGMFDGSNNIFHHTIGFIRRQDRYLEEFLTDVDEKDVKTEESPRESETEA